MLLPHAAGEVSQTLRMSMFRLLVVCQDYGMSVPEAREMIGRRYGLDDGQVRGLEREGLDALWPPLHAEAVR
jgi:hypothetical protein